jgi:hypothetical protein
VIDLHTANASEMECLKSSVKRLMTAGTVTTVVGTPMLIGGVMHAEKNRDPDDLYDFVEDIGSIMVGVLIAGGGMLLIDTGITLFIIGAVRNSRLNRIPAHDPGIGHWEISPVIKVNPVNQAPSFGMGLTFTF